MTALRPEADNFNKLLVTGGTALLALGVTVPWLMLREDSALRIPEGDFANLSPRAREF